MIEKRYLCPKCGSIQKLHLVFGNLCIECLCRFLKDKVPVCKEVIVEEKEH